MRATLIAAATLTLASAFNVPHLAPRAHTARCALRLQEAEPAEPAEPAEETVAVETTEETGSQANMVEGLDYGSYTNPMTSWNKNAPPEDPEKVKAAQAKRAAYFESAASESTKIKVENPDEGLDAGGQQGILAVTVIGALAAAYFVNPSAFGQ